GGKRLVIARVHPALVFQYRPGAGRDSRSPPEYGKSLDLLQRVARYTGAQTLPHNAMQVDEDLAAQQFVDGVLARRVDAHELLDCRGLVGAVVVDVHGRMRGQSFVEEADQRLEGSSFRDAVVRPARPVFPPVPAGVAVAFAFGDQEPEEEMQASGRLPE